MQDLISDVLVAEGGTLRAVGVFYNAFLKLNVLKIWDVFVGDASHAGAF